MISKCGNKQFLYEIFSTVSFENELLRHFMQKILCFRTLISSIPGRGVKWFKMQRKNFLMSERLSTQQHFNYCRATRTYLWTLENRKNSARVLRSRISMFTCQFTKKTFYGDIFRPDLGDARISAKISWNQTQSKSFQRGVCSTKHHLEVLVGNVVKVTWDVPCDLSNYNDSFFSLMLRRHQHECVKNHLIEKKMLKLYTSGVSTVINISVQNINFIFFKWSAQFPQFKSEF